MPGNRDYSQHWPPCSCVICTMGEYTCECHGRTFTTYPGFRRHLTSQKQKGKRGAKQPATAAVVPDGLGFLKRILASPTNLGTYNLSVISRFCAALNQIRPMGVYARFTRSHKSILSQLGQGFFENKLLDIKTRLTEAQAQAVYNLARSVNVSPSDVVSLLVSYGIEHLAAELRANAVAPPVGNPNVVQKTVTTVPTASEEYLREKYPEVAKEYTHYEHTEFARPTPMVRKGRSAFPQSEETN